MSRAVGVASCGLVIMVGAGGSVLAGDWQITPSISINETYTDNVNLTSDDGDQNSDLISEIAPGISIRGRGGRTSLDLDYSFRQFFFKNTDQDESTNRLNATGQIELWDRVAFIDGTASMSRQVVDSRGATTDTAAGEFNNRTDVRTFDISPYFLHHFGSWVETESRYRYSTVSVSGDAAEDTTTLTETFRANSGRQFQRLRWSLLVNRFKEMRDGDAPSNKTLMVDNDYTYVWNRKVSILAGIGYEDIEDNTLIDQPEGVTWNAGLALNPGPRTSLRATFGRRFDDDNFAFDLSHQLSSRTRVTANYSESLESSQRLVARDLGFVGTDVDGNLIDLRTGLPFNPGTDAFGLQTETFRQKRFFTSLNGSRKRNRFNVAAFWEERKTDGTGTDDTVYGIAGNLSRTLSRRTTGSVRLTYRRTKFEGGEDRTDDFYAVTGNLSYQIFRNTSAVLSYSYTQRDSDADANDVTENAVVLRLRREF